MLLLFSWEFAQKINLIPVDPAIFSSTLVDFMRFFDQPYTSNVLEPIRTILVQSAYDQYDYVLTLLNSIVIACSLLIAGLTFSFAFIFREFENMETKAFAKLCAVLPKEQFPREMSKIIKSYEAKIGSSSALSDYTKNSSIWSSEKSKKSQTMSQSVEKNCTSSRFSTKNNWNVADCGMCTFGKLFDDKYSSLKQTLKYCFPTWKTLIKYQMAFLHTLQSLQFS